MSIYVAIALMSQEFWIHGWRGGSEYEMAELYLSMGEKT